MAESIGDVADSMAAKIRGIAVAPTSGSLDEVMFLSFRLKTDDGAFCSMMRDLLFGVKSDADFLLSFSGVHEAALKARDDMGVEPGDDDATFELIKGKLRCVKGDRASEWYVAANSTGVTVPRGQRPDSGGFKP